MDATGLYLDRIGKFPLLSTEEERELSAMIQTGKQAAAELEEGAAKTVGHRRALRNADVARERFMNANLRLVVSVAKKYPSPDGWELLDLVQEGNIGLARAVDKFDYSKGFKFSTYATYWIRQAIGRSIDSRGDLINIPAAVVGEYRAEVRAAAANCDKVDAKYAEIGLLMRPQSLDAPVGADDSSVTQADLFVDDRTDVDTEMHDRNQFRVIGEVLGSLSDREQTAVMCYFGFVDGQKQGYAEIGRKLGVSASVAKRVVVNAVKKMQKNNVLQSWHAGLDDSIDPVSDNGDTVPFVWQDAPGTAQMRGVTADGTEFRTVSISEAGVNKGESDDLADDWSADWAGDWAGDGVTGYELIGETIDVADNNFVKSGSGDEFLIGLPEAD